MKPCECSRWCSAYTRRVPFIRPYVPNEDGETIVILCPKDTQISLSAIALHFNRKLVSQWYKSGTENECTAKYWRDPKAFRPDRFLEDWNRDAFIPFSAGARSCIGRRYVKISVTWEDGLGNAYQYVDC